MGAPGATQRDWAARAATSRASALDAEDDEDEPLHAQADLFQYVCAGLLFAGLVGYAAYLNHSEGTAALCAKAGLQDAHGALAEKLCRGGKLHVSGDELLAFFNGSALAL